MNFKDQSVVIVDYGIGNIHSVFQALLECGAKNVVISSDHDVINQCSHLIVPGVGSFQAGMLGLEKNHLIEPIKLFASSGRPLLGICLGAQMLLSESEEFGLHAGLNLIEGKVIHIPKCKELSYRVPLIGWVDMQITCNDPILAGMNAEESFYFVHSLHCKPLASESQLLAFKAGEHNITALISKDNIYGAQFHPEKSSASGLRFLTNFLSL